MRISNSWIEQHVGALSPRALHLLALAIARGGTMHDRGREIAGRLGYRGRTWSRTLRESLEELEERGHARGVYEAGVLHLSISSSLEIALEESPYTLLALSDILALSSPYALRLYILSRQYLRIGHRTETPERWAGLLGHAGDIRALRRAMERALEDIERRTPLRVSLSIERWSRKVRSITIHVRLEERERVMPHALEELLSRVPEPAQATARAIIVRELSHHPIERLERSLAYSLEHEPREWGPYLSACISHDWALEWAKAKELEERKRKELEERKRKELEERKRKELEERKQEKLQDRIDDVIQSLSHEELEAIQREAESMIPSLGETVTAKKLRELQVQLKVRSIIKERYL